jgi:hypothetical protein
MEAKHTPGPWTVLDCKELQICADHNCTKISVMPWTAPDAEGVSENDMANARLIAAAPELLAAAKTYLGARLNQRAAAKSELEAAISKAEGK